MSVLCQQEASTTKKTCTSATKSASNKNDNNEHVESDDDFDMFGSDEDDDEKSAEQKRIRDENLKNYAAKKTNKPGPIAKSSVILDVKPWDDETDLKDLEAKVRTIQMDGLLWGASKLLKSFITIKLLYKFSSELTLSFFFFCKIFIWVVGVNSIIF